MECVVSTLQAPAVRLGPHTRLAGLLRNLITFKASTSVEVELVARE